MKQLSKYKEIEQNIEAKILRGEYPKQGMIPTENELAASYNCSRATVRQALGNLVAKGLVERTPGKGTFVSGFERIQHDNEVESFTKEMQRLGKSASTELLEFQLKEATPLISQKVAVEENAMVYYFERLRKADEVPVTLEQTYLSVAQFPDLTVNTLVTSKYEFIETSLGMEIDYVEQKLFPILANTHISQILGVQIGEPVIQIDSTTYLENGQIIDFTRLFTNPNYMQLNIIRKK